MLMVMFDRTCTILDEIILLLSSFLCTMLMLMLLRVASVLLSAHIATMMAMMRCRIPIFPPREVVMTYCDVDGCDLDLMI